MKMAGPSIQLAEPELESGTKLKADIHRSPADLISANVRSCSTWNIMFG